MKKRTYILICIVLVVINIIVSCNIPEEPVVKHAWQMKYEVKVCNNIGCDHYYVDSVIHKDGSYVLADSCGKIQNEIILGTNSNIVVIITKLN